MRKKNILENSLLWSHLTKSLKMFYTLNSEKRFSCEKKVLIIHSKVECKNSIQHRKYLIENFMRLKLQLYKIWFGTIYRYIYMIWKYLYLYYGAGRGNKWGSSFFPSFFLYFGFCIYYLASVEWLQAIKSREKKSL